MTLSPLAEAARAVRREALYHEARVLILIDAFTSAENPLVGLTKLVKLDFLLRYPVMAERLLPEGTEWGPDIGPTRDERLAVESRMIRYKYGPWDDRYYPLIGALVGKQLAEFADARDDFAITCTSTGRATAATLSATPEWSIFAQRSRFLREHFDLPGRTIKDMIYANLPDVAALPLRSEI